MARRLVARPPSSHPLTFRCCELLYTLHGKLARKYISPSSSLVWIRVSYPSDVSPHAWELLLFLPPVLQTSLPHIEVPALGTADQDVRGPSRQRCLEIQCLPSCHQPVDRKRQGLTDTIIKYCATYPKRVTSDCGFPHINRTGFENG